MCRLDYDPPPSQIKVPISDISECNACSPPKCLGGKCAANNPPLSGSSGAATLASCRTPYLCGATYFCSLVWAFFSRLLPLKDGCGRRTPIIHGELRGRPAVYACRLQRSPLGAPCVLRGVRCFLPFRRSGALAYFASSVPLCTPSVLWGGASHNHGVVCCFMCRGYMSRKHIRRNKHYLVNI